MKANVKRSRFTLIELLGKKRPVRSRRTAFTLIELLVVISIIAILALFSGQAFSAEAAAAVGSKPNVIVIFTDDQTYRAIGYNNPTLKTPHLDALAESGVIFERAYVASPICGASRASMMTGLFPQQHGSMALDTRAFSAYRSGARTGGQRVEQTLPNRLKKAGYLTAFYGKSHLGKPKTYGFDTGDELGGHDDVKTFEQASAFIKSRKGRK